MWHVIPDWLWAAASRLVEVFRLEMGFIGMPSICVLGWMLPIVAGPHA